MPPNIADLCSALPAITFAPGDVLLPEGAKTGRLYVLLQGTLEVVKGDFQVNLVSERGAIFGDISALLDVPHMATVRALTEGSAFFSDDAAAFLESNPAVAYPLAQLLAQRLHGVTGYLADLKRQFEDQASHLGMVDEILESLVHQQQRAFTPGSDRDEPDY